MSAYAVGYFRTIQMGPEIIKYLEEIDATLEPFAGRFLVHGGETTVLEGRWPGNLVVIGFPDRAAAQDWYRSDGYQAILNLRTGNASGDVIIVDGVCEDYRATAILR